MDHDALHRIIVTTLDDYLDQVDDWDDLDTDDLAENIALSIERSRGC